MNIRKHISCIAAFLRRITGLVPASVEYQHAVMQAEALFEETQHRYFLIWDSGTQHLIPLTYQAWPGRRDSYQYLRLRGKFPPLTFEQFKHGSFYYTRSRYSRNKMEDAIMQQRLDLLRRRYFLR